MILSIETPYLLFPLCLVPLDNTSFSGHGNDFPQTLLVRKTPTPGETAQTPDLGAVFGLEGPLHTTFGQIHHHPRSGLCSQPHRPDPGLHPHTRPAGRPGYSASPYPARPRPHSPRSLIALPQASLETPGLRRADTYAGGNRGGFRVHPGLVGLGIRDPQDIFLITLHY